MSNLYIAYLVSAAISIWLLLWLSSYDQKDGVRQLTLQDVVFSVGLGSIPIVNLICVLGFTMHSGTKIVVWKLNKETNEKL
jgi:hypothetical protein